MKRIFSLLFAFFFFGMVVPNLAFATSATAVVAVISQFTKPVSGVLATSVDVSNLTAYAGKNAKNLITTMVNSLSITNDIVVIPNVKNKLRIGKLEVSDGARPFSSTEEFQSGDLNYTDRFLEVNDGKRELQIDAQGYRTSYLSEFTSTGSGASKADEIPFAQYTWDKVMKKLAAELNNKTAFSGFDKTAAVAFSGAATYTADEDYVTFTPGAGGPMHYYLCIDDTAAAESPDTHPAKWKKVTAEAITPGIDFHIQALITSTDITPQAIGEITAVAGVARAGFKKLFRSMPIVYRDGGVIINCSWTDFDLLLDDIEDISKYTDVDWSKGQAVNYIYLPGTQRKCIVKPATWIPGRRMIAGPAAKHGGQWKNQALLLGTDLVSDMNDIATVKSELWTLKAGIKFLLGFQVSNPDELRINDQE